jgi:hypothetical protein
MIFFAAKKVVSLSAGSETWYGICLITSYLNLNLKDRLFGRKKIPSFLKKISNLPHFYRIIWNYKMIRAHED